VSEAAGEPERARRELEIALRIAPDGAVMREIMRLRSESELSPEDIDKSTLEIIEAEGKGGGDAELMLLASRCYLNLGPRFQARTIELVDSLSPWRMTNRSFHVRHAMLSAIARSARGTPDDLNEARAFLEEIRPLLDDPYRENFVVALLGLTKIDAKAVVASAK
jgi:hypothetical protein